MTLWRRRLLFGAAAASATIAWATHDLPFLQLHRANAESGRAPVAIYPDPKDPRKKVILAPIGLRYFEGEDSLELTVEMASNRRGSYYIVYLWTAKAWIREMPQWCRHRREEILPEIKKLTAREPIEWVAQD